MEKNNEKTIVQLNVDIYSAESKLEHLRFIYFKVSKIETDLDRLLNEASILRKTKGLLLKSAEEFLRHKSIKKDLSV